MKQKKAIINPNKKIIHMKKKIQTILKKAIMRNQITRVNQIMAMMSKNLLNPNKVMTINQTMATMSRNLLSPKEIMTINQITETTMNNPETINLHRKTPKNTAKERNHHQRVARKDSDPLTDMARSLRTGMVRSHRRVVKDKVQINPRISQFVMVRTLQM
uniref:(northern house mosquito) hypothetical protein n=1 Tax=Culex pipiens TaxID=7175 RepID=A0A8D8NMC0_CULPI